MTQSDIGEFIAARLGDEEVDARAAAEESRSQRWKAQKRSRENFFDITVIAGEGPDDVALANGTGVKTGAHIARQDPAATLARVAALRSLVNEHGARKPYPKASPEYAQCARCHEASDYGDNEDWPCDVVKGVAAIWASHPDYRAE